MFCSSVLQVKLNTELSLRWFTGYCSSNKKEEYAKLFGFVETI